MRANLLLATVLIRRPQGRAIMRTTVLPSDEEVPALEPGPGSLTWTRAADSRNLIAAGYALVLQVAHPVVGAGVAEHSDYTRHPWERLFRTLDLTTALIYSDPASAAAVARDLRARHRQIRGKTRSGRSYHALEPDAYAWVWATLFGSIVAAHARFGTPLQALQREGFWTEWRLLGRLLGVRERDLPETLGGFDAYFDQMVRDVLEENETVTGVIASLRAPPAPSLLRYAAPVWRLGTLPGARMLHLATVGLLPPILRRRLGLSWTLAQECELRAFGVATRSLTPLMPRALREFGPSYLRWRSSAGWPGASASSFR
jgi:uncharacterized protein (DUF2236 family)